jgi:hypothetical protein
MTMVPPELHRTLAGHLTTYLTSKLGEITHTHTKRQCLYIAALIIPFFLIHFLLDLSQNLTQEQRPNN